MGMKPPKLPIIDAEFEVIEPGQATPPQKSRLVALLEKVPISIWIILGVGVMALQQGAPPQ